MRCDAAEREAKREGLPDSTTRPLDNSNGHCAARPTMATVETLLASTKQRVTAILHHGECMHGGAC